MKIIRYDNPAVTDVSTSSTPSLSRNDTSIICNDASSFSAEDFVLFEEVGHELCEICQIDSIVGNTIELVKGLQYPHDASTTITKLNYDKCIIKYSSYETGTYTTLATLDLDYSNPHNSIEYVDSRKDASDLVYYKIYYYNSSTETETLATTLHNEDNFSYISIENFRQETGFTESELTDAEISVALFNALEWIKDNAYNVVTLQSYVQDNIFELDLDGMEFAHWTGNKILTKYDFEIYQYNTSTNYITYLTDKLIKINENSYKLIFSETIPSDNEVLYIKVPVTFKRFSEIRNVLANISKLIAVNYILRNVNISKIRNGVTSWTAGGTSVNRDTSSVDAAIETNLKQAKKLLEQILKVYMKRTPLRTERSSLNRKSSRYAGNIKFPSGNVIGRD